ncbi:MAG: tRNA pseudouridine(38-40) synthase TruA [Alphaproteobacteria bacterium]|nr:tRNA pseudouridine(38-40) synthase TruA [Alphaproteobacteria bacterium]
MQRWKLTLEYDGAGFCGWQMQKDARSVQQTVEEAIKGFADEHVRIHVAGRTDAGVHALAQVCHADIDRPSDADTVRDALNYYMRKHPVIILKAEAVTTDFHARFSAQARHYMFRVINRPRPLTIDRGYAVHFYKPLELQPMQEAAAVLLGHHDFTSFRAINCQSPSPMKTMLHTRVEQKDEEFRFYFSAKSFLYHQVRNMVGSLFFVGTGQWSVAEFKRMFEAKERAQAGPTAPPQGLYFMGVTYD